MNVATESSVMSSSCTDVPPLCARPIWSLGCSIHQSFHASLLEIKAGRGQHPRSMPCIRSGLSPCSPSRSLHCSCYLAAVIVSTPGILPSVLRLAPETAKPPDQDTSIPSLAIEIPFQLYKETKVSPSCPDHQQHPAAQILSKSLLPPPGQQLSIVQNEVLHWSFHCRPGHRRQRRLPQPEQA